MISIKSVFYAPVFAGAVIWRLRDPNRRKRNALPILVGLAVTALIAWVFFYWHTSTLAVNLEVSQQTRAGSIFSKVFLEGIFPRKDDALQWSYRSRAQLILIGSGIFLIFSQWNSQSKFLIFSQWNSQSKTRGFLLLTFALPLLGIFFYRNAFPYFFPFLVAPAMILVAVAVSEIEPMISRRPFNIYLYLLLGNMMLNTLIQFHRDSQRDQEAQREILSLVYRMFPQPAPYIDRNSMVSRYPKQGFFMSTWGVETYRTKGIPVFEKILEMQRPVFLIANSYTLVNAMNGIELVDGPWQLLERDKSVLKSNYIHHWGALWVAGKSFELDSGSTDFRLLIPGFYTVESLAAINLDERFLSNGETVYLEPGLHRIGSNMRQQVHLRYGNHLPKPSTKPSGRIYSGF